MSVGVSFKMSVSVLYECLAVQAYAAISFNICMYGPLSVCLCMHISIHVRIRWVDRIDRMVRWDACGA